MLIIFAGCNNSRVEINRPKDVWAFRSVLDKKPRMFTLALNAECYVAYDLAACSLYKVWKGGVDLQGAAYTDKKNVQPVSWGTPYADALYNKWRVTRNGRDIQFSISNHGYKFAEDQVFITHVIRLEGGKNIRVDEKPEYIQDENGRPGFERVFATYDVPDDINISLTSPTKRFILDNNRRSRLTVWLKRLPEQNVPAQSNEYDHRGRYYMEKSDCFTCHEIDKQTVGPSFQQVASKYGKQENATRGLIEKVRSGGTGNWGTAVMNPHPDLSETEIRTMLDYVFSLNAPATAIKPAAARAKTNSDTQPGFGAPLEGVHPSYDVQTLHTADFRPKVGGLAFTTDGKLLVTTWDSIGAVFMLEGVETGDTAKIRVKRIATGLAEPLGIEVVEGEIYVLQKQELTRLSDTDGDGIIDQYTPVCNTWGVTPDFHEFAFGLVHKDEYFYATLSMAMRLMSTEKQHPDRGKTIRIDKENGT